MAIGTIHSRARLRASRRGFTTIELLLSLAVTAMVGMVVVMMLAGVTTATDRQHDTRRASTQRQVAIVRLGELTREAAMVGAMGPRHLLLWLHDEDDDGKPRLSELRRIEWDEQAGEVWVYEAGDRPWLDDLMQDRSFDSYDALTRHLKGTDWFPGRRRLNDVTGWSVVLDEDDPHAARLLRLRVTLDQPGGEDTATIIAALRPPAPAGTDP